ncbi:MAG: hybrid sensor histidine kinase/response regulator [Rubrivivax sp.]|nr:MAG: hybrid sensor histidine kinase/response regulator [Rubrivivax sp.]
MDLLPPGVPPPLSVLLLEDDPMDAELLMATLNRAPDVHVAVRWVRDEAAYEAALAEGGFDVMLSDYSLPGYSGREALEKARQVLPDMPIIIVSGMMGEELAVEMLKAGATDYLLKSRLERLPNLLRRTLSEVRERRQRLSAERALKESNTLYSRLVESLRDYAVLLLDPAGHILAWNNASEAIFGWTRDEALKQHASILFRPEDRIGQVFEQELHAAAAQGRSSDDRWLMRKNGEAFFATGVTTILYGDDGRLIGFSKIVRDGTQAQEAALALKSAKEEAERANRAKDRFLAVLSHELRTPLTPISAAAEVLDRRLSLPQDLKNLVAMIRRNVALEARLIDDLLDLTSIDHGKLSMQSKPVDLQVVIDAVLEMLGDDVQRKGLKLVTLLANGPLMVRGDASRLQQILWNVVRNAVKFTDPQGTLTVRSWQDGSQVMVSCQDTGIGIQPDALERLFTPFEQVDPMIAKQFGGLGLGLAIASGLAHTHGGLLRADSQGPGHGATFTLSLPVMDETGEATPAEAGSQDMSTAAPPSVLLVEDNVDSAEALAMALEMQGYAVTHAGSVRDALAQARLRVFDAVISDLGLPDGHGTEVAEALSPRMPCVALSGFGSEEDLRTSRAAGFVAHLTKPADPADIDAVLKGLIAHRMPAPGQAS